MAHNKRVKQSCLEVDKGGREIILETDVNRKLNDFEAHTKRMLCAQ